MDRDFLKPTIIELCELVMVYIVNCMVCLSICYV